MDANDSDSNPAVPELRQLLDSGPAPLASPDALRAIVGRRNRWLIRSLGIALGVAVVAGPLVGYAIGDSGTSSTTAVNSAAAPNASSGPAGALAEIQANGTSSAGVTSGITASGFTATQLFLRDTSDGIRIRAYLNEFSPPKLPVSQCAVAQPAPLQTVPPPAGAPPNAPSAGGASSGSGVSSSSGASSSSGPAVSSGPLVTTGTSGTTGSGTVVAPGPGPAPCVPLPVCQAGGIVDAQLSNDQVAGQIGGTLFSADGSADPALQLLNASVVGNGDPTPIGTVIAHAGAGVDHVRLTVPGSGTDEMQPKNGYVVLARGVAGLSPAKLPASPLAPVPQPATGGVAAPGTPLNTGKQATGLTAVGMPVGFGFPSGSKVEALDGGGKVLAAVDLPSWQAITARGCVSMGIGFSGGGGVSVAPPVPAAGTATSGSAGVSSGAVSPAAKP